MKGMGLRVSEGSREGKEREQGKEEYSVLNCNYFPRPRPLRRLTGFSYRGLFHFKGQNEGQTVPSISKLSMESQSTSATVLLVP